MARKRPFDLRYDPATKEHLHAVDSKYHSPIRAAIEEQLALEPDNETRNRKPLRQPAPFEATWELRFGPDNRFRVLYGLDHERRQVQIQAIGVKRGNHCLSVERRSNCEDRFCYRNSIRFSVVPEGHQARTSSRNSQR
jgi:hypothetical protein